MKKPHSILISTLAAAAAMSVPAFGVISTTTTNLDDNVTYSGTIWATNVSGVTNSTNLSNSARTYAAYQQNADGTAMDVSSTTYNGGTDITGAGKFYNYFFNGNETAYVGNTLRLTGATADHTVTTDWRTYVWLGGLITGIYRRSQ